MKRITNYLLVITSLVVGAAAGAQPTAAEWAAFKARATADSARLAQIEKVVGVQDAMLTNSELRARGRPTELIAGNYNHSYRILQFGDAFTDVFNRFSSLPTSGTVVLPPPAPAPAPAPAPPPAPSAGTIPPLSPASQAEVVAALRRSIHFDWQTPWVNRIERELAAGIYSIVDKDLVDVLNFMIFGGMTAADNAIVERYRVIIDQRIPGTDTLYPPGDSRIRRVSGSPGSSTTVPPPALPPGQGAPNPTAWPTVAADNIQFRANTGRFRSQSGITDEYCGELRMNGWDGGLRFAQNLKDNTFTNLCAPALPAALWGPDANAGWSYTQFPRAADAASVPASALEGQSLVVDGGFGQGGYHFGTGAPLSRGLLIAAQRSGQPMYLAVGAGRVPGGLATNRVGLIIEPVGSSQNPVLIFADGSYRRVKTCSVAGLNVLCF